MEDNRGSIYEIVILSGKGGTGKTSVSGALSVLFDDKVIADCDINAANLFLLLDLNINNIIDFKAGIKPSILHERCSDCHICIDVCNFNAISACNSVSERSRSVCIDYYLCEGCGVCEWFCPDDAIILTEPVCGHLYVADSRYGPMVYAELFPGEENTGKLVHEVKAKAREICEANNYPLILIDGPPGIACPVISSLSGATHACIVIEPTLSGISDLKRIAALCNHFKVRTSCIINKGDLSLRLTEEIISYLKENNVFFLGAVPFDEMVMNANERGAPFIELYPDCPASAAMQDIFNKLNDWLRIKQET